jgi:hypothetical protein
VVGACDAPLAGPRGNLEHFVYARRWADRGGSTPAEVSLV